MNKIPLRIRRGLDNITTYDIKDIRLDDTHFGRHDNIQAHSHRLDILPFQSARGIFPLLVAVARLSWYSCRWRIVMTEQQQVHKRCLCVRSS